LNAVEIEQAITEETTESLDADWEATAEVLNKNDSLKELLGSW